MVLSVVFPLEKVTVVELSESLPRGVVLGGEEEGKGGGVRYVTCMGKGLGMVKIMLYGNSPRKAEIKKESLSGT